MPLKVGSGSNVTVPLALTVYVPCPETSRVVCVHPFGVSLEPQSLSEINGCPVAIVSLPSGVIIWFTFQSPSEISFVAAGFAITVGAYVDDTF